MTFAIGISRVSPPSVISGRVIDEGPAARLPAEQLRIGCSQISGLFNDFEFEHLSYFHSCELGWPCTEDRLAEAVSRTGFWALARKILALTTLQRLTLMEFVEYSLGCGEKDFPDVEWAETPDPETPGLKDRLRNSLGQFACEPFERLQKLSLPM